MKKGYGLDSLKAIVLVGLAAAFLTPLQVMGHAHALMLPPMLKAEASFDITLIDTSLDDVKSIMTFNLTELDLTEGEALEPIQYSPPSFNVHKPQSSFLPPPTAPFRPRRKDNTFFYATLSSTVVLQAADYITTLNALKYDSLQEGNPLLKNVADDPLLFGAVKVCIAGLQVVLLKKLHENNKTLAWIVGTAMNVAMSYVVANNINKIQKVQNF